MRTSSGFVIVGSGMSMTSYLEGLQNLGATSARMVVGRSDMLVYDMSPYLRISCLVRY